MFIRSGKFKAHDDEVLAIIKKVLADIQFKFKKPGSNLHLTDATIVASGNNLNIVKNGETIGSFIRYSDRWELCLSGSTIKDLSMYLVRAIEKLLGRL